MGSMETNDGVYVSVWRSKENVNPDVTFNSSFKVEADANTLNWS